MEAKGFRLFYTLAKSQVEPRKMAGAKENTEDLGKRSLKTKRITNYKLYEYLSCQQSNSV